MSYVVYGLGRTVITLRDASGNPTVRYTLQVEQREGLVLTFTPEGTAHDLGSGAGWAKRWNHRGFRPSISIRWDAGTISSKALWSGSAWGNEQVVSTAVALSELLNAAFLVPCLVQPHKDHAFTFVAQPDPSKGFALKDRKRVIHTDLTLDLVGQDLGAIPTWVAP